MGLEIGAEWADRWMGGWVDEDFININDMYNNDVGKGELRVYEAH